MFISQALFDKAVWLVNCHCSLAANVKLNFNYYLNGFSSVRDAVPYSWVTIPFATRSPLIHLSFSIFLISIVVQLVAVHCNPCHPVLPFVTLCNPCHPVLPSAFFAHQSLLLPPSTPATVISHFATHYFTPAGSPLHSATIIRILHFAYITDLHSISPHLMHKTVANSSLTPLHKYFFASCPLASLLHTLLGNSSNNANDIHVTMQ